MELITPIGIDFFTILQPFPDEESRLEVTIKPFNFTVFIEFHLNLCKQKKLIEFFKFSGFKVWICLLVTTSVFVLVSAIIIKNKMDINKSNSARQSISQTMYNQIDYVIRHFTNQGKILVTSCSILFIQIDNINILINSNQKVVLGLTQGLGLLSEY